MSGFTPELAHAYGTGIVIGAGAGLVLILCAAAIYVWGIYH